MGVTSTNAIALSAAEIVELKRVPLGAIDGVTNAVLWTDGISITGILTVDAGHQLGVHRHADHHHHMWVAAGEAEIAGRRLGPGSYVHVPPGVEHDIDARGTAGVTVYYSYTLSEEPARR